MRLAGIVLDIYDDPSGEILRSKLASKEAFAPKLAAAEALSALPDRLFAFVATNNGETVRKYAMHDAEHVATSVAYFLDRFHYFPEVVRPKIASNLVNACGWYDIEPPEQLVKAALLGAALTALDVAGTASSEASRHRDTMDRFRAAQASGTKVAGQLSEEVQLSNGKDRSIQRGAEGSGLVEKFIRNYGPGGIAATAARLMDTHDAPEPTVGTKAADLQGSTVMSVSGADAKKTPGSHIQSKTAWQHAGDVTKLEPAPVKVASTATHFAVGDQYPIDTEEQVKRAAEYFEDFYSDFPYDVRREYADNVWTRAQQLGVKVAGRLLDYAGDELGPYIELELSGRVETYGDRPGGASYGVLHEKYASMNPKVLVEMLASIDRRVGVTQFYGHDFGFRDPYAAVYGSAKIAAFAPDPDEVFSWTEGPDYVSGPALKSLASTSNLDAVLGAGFSKGFQKDPVSVFRSLPAPQKVVLSRLARQSQ